MSFVLAVSHSISKLETANFSGNLAHYNAVSLPWNERSLNKLLCKLADNTVLYFLVFNPLNANFYLGKHSSLGIFPWQCVVFIVEKLQIYNFTC